MWKVYLCVFLVVFLSCCSADYIGAVVEYNPKSSISPAKTYEENAQNYVSIIKEAKNAGAQIIVFPEYGLTGFIDSFNGYGLLVPSIGTSDFSNASRILQLLSNAAKVCEIYVVVNLLELVKHENEENLMYNSNLVFANNGTLVAKYRKINLYNEYALTPVTEKVTFTTDFGTFGIMTCADIIYYHPAQTLLEKTGITDVIFPSGWTSYLPFYMSIEVQMGYAVANEVNLLAANINDPTYGRGGSGIYSSNKVLNLILTDQNETKIAVAKVRSPGLVSETYLLKDNKNKVKSNRDLENYKNLTNFQSDEYVYKPLDLSQEVISEEICDGSFCCTFNIVTQQNETNLSENYKLVAFNGKAQFDTKQESFKHCNLIACLNEDKSSCGLRPLTAYKTKFREIIVRANNTILQKELIRPTTLKGNLQLVYNVEYAEKRENEIVVISYKTTTPVSNVVRFGLFAKDGANTPNISFVLIIFTVFITNLFSLLGTL